VADALSEGRLGGYAADVFAFEDWARADRPRAIPDRLLASDRTLLTPHIGSAVTAVRLAIEHRAADNIIAVLEGRTPQDALNAPVAQR
jgi:phosphonate dehydrogenase